MLEAVREKILFIDIKSRNNKLDDLHAGYRAMAADRARELEAAQWCNGLMKDMLDETQ